ncbi:MAG: hypothetical protein FWE34_01155 [Defluviitaleaceae bacterium]|nr:hypothetical protein [Defluviitaleaceae bacterium]
MFKNKAFAWFLAIFVMMLSVPIGAYTSYAGMRSSTVAAFEREMMPLISQAMVHVHDMGSIAQNYLSGEIIIGKDISRIVSEIQNTSDPMEIYEQFVLLHRAQWSLYDALIGENVEMANTNRNLFMDFHRNFLGLDLLLIQAGYNDAARDFNERLTSGLGFIASPFFNDMPRFDEH